MRSIRTLTRAALLTLGLLVAGGAVPMPANAGTVLPAPAGVTATRVPASVKDFVVSWKPVVGALDHYNVSVFYAGQDHITTVAANTTQLAVTGVDFVTQYRITVSTRDVAGVGTTSPVFVLEPAVPGPVRALTAVRDAAATTLTMAWTAPTWLGHQPLTSYDVLVTRLADGVVVSNQSVATPTATVPGLDPTKQYSAKVTARNAFGTGTVATALVGNDRPATSTGLVATRDDKSPSVVHVTWKAPAQVGSGPITYYQFMSGVGMLKDTLTVTTTSADVALDSTRTGYVAVRACNDAGCGLLTPALTVLSSAAQAAAAAVTSNPFVMVSNTGGFVTVETRGYIGATSVYPRLVFRVFPTMGNAGYTDTQIGQNGARIITYTTVPTGTYTVMVSGLSATNVETEIARKVIIVNGDGMLTAQQWEVIKGSAKISGSVVDLPVAGENRVLSTKPLASPDMVFSTDATLKTGSGYGVWFRAGLDDLKRINGFTFQYDPLYGNAFIIRHWYQGTECSTPIAKSAFPAGFAINAKHRLIVVVQGDTIWASVDGVEMFRVASLKAAAAASPCKYPLPTGTRIGFRTWNTSPATFENTTLR